MSDSQKTHRVAGSGQASGGKEMTVLGSPRDPQGETCVSGARGGGAETWSTASLTQGEEFPRFTLLGGDCN